eukprot:3952225-Pleurochrysis_carterae.AAC.1
MEVICHCMLLIDSKHTASSQHGLFGAWPTMLRFARGAVNVWAGRPRPIWAIEPSVGRIAGGGAVKIGASHERHSQYSNEYEMMTML